MFGHSFHARPSVSRNVDDAVLGVVLTSHRVDDDSIPAVGYLAPSLDIVELERANPPEITLFDAEAVVNYECASEASDFVPKDTKFAGNLWVKFEAHTIPEDHC